MAGLLWSGCSTGTTCQDKDGGIINNATDIDVIPLVERLVYVGVESDRLIGEMSDEFEPADWEPTSKMGMDQFMEAKSFQSRIG